MGCSCGKSKEHHPLCLEGPAMGPAIEIPEKIGKARISTPISCPLDNDHVCCGSAILHGSGGLMFKGTLEETNMLY